MIFIKAILSIVSNVVFKGWVIFMLWNYINNFVNIPSITLIEGLIISIWVWLYHFVITWTVDGFKSNLK